MKISIPHSETSSLLEKRVKKNLVALFIPILGKLKNCSELVFKYFGHCTQQLDLHLLLTFFSR